MSDEPTTTPKVDLILDRFCGREKHPVAKATWNLYPNEKLGMMNLCLLVEAGRGTLLHDDTEALDAEPWWEVDVLETHLSASSLVPGAKFSVPSGFDETRGGYITNFYYCEHESTDNNAVEILAVEDTRLLIRITGETIDVNFYDGSKSPTKLFIETWFNRDPGTMRSMQ